MTINIDFPAANEYPAYAEMYMQYVQKDGSLIEQLKESLKQTKNLINGLSVGELNLQYAKDKWTLKEVLVHIVDDERIYAYRAMAFARNEKKSLPGFDQDDYTRYADSAERPIAKIMAEYEAVRWATIHLFAGLTEVALLRIGSADGKRSSVRALGYHILGHEMHHLKMIRENYLQR